MATTHLLRFVACALLVSGCGGALAQHVWLDAKGVKQYSDQPPPAGTPASRVLQSPGVRATASAANPASASADQAPAPSLAERNAAFEKRRIEQAEREAKEGEQTRMAADRARNCDQARTYQRTLANGNRIARLDKNGERVYLTEQDRAQETATVEKALAQCK